MLLMVQKHTRAGESASTDSVIGRSEAETGDADADQVQNHWHLEVPCGPGKFLTLAQLKERLGMPIS
jgi:hypothetical protein